MSINLHLPENVILKPCITVFGVGGAGCNAVNNMIASGLEGAKFVVANTDAQCLEYSKADKKIQLGETITRGLGAGASPEIGRAAAEEAIELIFEHLNGSNMIFITAGMGGGTGTGAAPVIAKAARERGILTVGVVTKPFHFEGVHRMKLAEMGLSELQSFVDTLIVIPNQNLFRIANEKTTFADAFKMADDVLRDGVRSITDLMIMPGLINLDFADIRAVMSEMGKAMMGSGEAEGENRAIVAAEAAISNPLLDNSSMKGAKGVLINITGGGDMTLFEVDEAANRIREEVDQEANIIFGSAFNETLEGKIRVSVVATGIEDLNKDINKLKPRLHQQPITPRAQLSEDPQQQNQNSAASSGQNNPVPKENNGYVIKNQNYREIARKNIPESYPPQRILEKELPAIDSEIQKQTDSFMSPKQIEPRIQSPRVQSDLQFLNSRPEKKETDHDRAEITKRTFDLFGRMASSVGLRSSQFDRYEKDDVITKSNFEMNEDSYNSNSENDDELVTEDMVDIPAFQRLKK